jgi:exo-1,4-beta-D-glucosaminidase
MPDTASYPTPSVSPKVATNLNTGWSIQSSARITGGGPLLSTTEVDSGGWYEADLPATVLGVLVDRGEFEDPFFGMNMRTIPGQGPFAENFSNHKMPEDSPFARPWWYRKTFDVPKDAGPHLFLRFDGINYRANIWLNGELLADSDTVAGSYRDFEFDATDRLHRDRSNVLAVEIFPPCSCDLAITWVDWNPSPPDKNMGLWRDVWLDSSGPVALRAPFVTTKLDGVELATLKITGELVNATKEAQRATVMGTIDGRSFSQDFDLPPRETTRFELDGSEHAALVLDQPRLWWPRFMGEPHLYDLTLDVLVDGRASDSDRQRVGLREIVADHDDAGNSRFRVNGQFVQIRGAGWAPDLFLRRDLERELAQIEYVKAMNLNTIRFEGMLERADLLEVCDREGIMVIAGWCCCDQWEKWDNWKPENFPIATESLRSQVRRVRRHPCMIAWWYGSDFAPPPPVERAYLDVLAEEGWPNASHSSASHRPSELTGPCGLKMEGPYEYVPPNYWLEDEERGGAHGFATEICPGPAVPPIESLRRMLPEENLWPIDEVWNYHAGGQEFHNIEMFRKALVERYGPVEGVEDFAALSQVMTYEAQRAMFEAYACRKPRATGIVQWMLNNAWPSLIWHVFDYYLRPGGGFFGTQRACAPLHVMLAPGRREVLVVNEHGEAKNGLRAEIEVLELDLSVRHKETRELDIAASSVLELSSIPEPRNGSGMFFVRLLLRDREGR